MKINNKIIINFRRVRHVALHDYTLHEMQEIKTAHIPQNGNHFCEI